MLRKKVDKRAIVPNLNNFMANEVLNPRVVRFGCRFEF